MAKKILVVDDEPDFCEALRDFLGSKGFEVAIALSGEEALPAYMQEKPDVVLLDIQMPGMDGLETLRELKALDPEAAVIMLTTIVDEPLAKQARAKGALEYITKPIDMDYLDTTIATTLGLIGPDA
ncbi:MAG: response regulator [bacterium]|nr:response regulator [bacterium]